MVGVFHENSPFRESKVNEIFKDEPKMTKAAGKHE